MMSVVGRDQLIVSRQEWEEAIAEARDLGYQQGLDVGKVFTDRAVLRAETAEAGLAEALRPVEARAEAAELEVVRLGNEYDRLMRGMAMAIAQRDARLVRLRWAEALIEGRTLALALARCLGERAWREGRYRAVWVGLSYPSAEVKGVLCAVCGMAGGIILAAALLGFGG